MSDSTGFEGKIKTSYLDSTPSWPEKKKAPEDAPNIIYIVLDDTGYSQLGCYGSFVERLILIRYRQMAYATGTFMSMPCARPQEAVY